MDDYTITEAIAFEIAHGLVKIGALTDSPPVAMRYEAMALEVERVADRLDDDFRDPTSPSYRNSDTAERVAGLRRTAPAFKGFAAALRGDNAALSDALAEAQEFGFAETIWTTDG